MRSISRVADVSIDTVSKLLAQAREVRRHRRRQGAVPRLGPQTRKRVMTLTRSFKDTVKARVDRDPAFKDALLTEGLNNLLEGDLDTGKAVLRDYINATIGFMALDEATGTPAKSLMRMFSVSGNPSASNLFPVFGHLQCISGVVREVRVA
jgi:hypothetical protein